MNVGNLPPALLRSGPIELWLETRLPDPTEYFIRAVDTVRANKERYASAEQHARNQRPMRPAYYDVARA